MDWLFWPYLGASILSSMSALNFSFLKYRRFIPSPHPVTLLQVVLGGEVSTDLLICCNPRLFQGDAACFPLLQPLGTNHNFREPTGPFTEPCMSFRMCNGEQPAIGSEHFNYLLAASYSWGWLHALDAPAVDSWCQTSIVGTFLLNTCCANQFSE